MVLQNLHDIGVFPRHPQDRCRVQEPDDQLIFYNRIQLPNCHVHHPIHY